MPSGTSPDPSSVGGNLNGFSQSSLHLGTGQPVTADSMLTMCIAARPCTNKAIGVTTTCSPELAAVDASSVSDSLETSTAAVGLTQDALVLHLLRAELGWH